MRWDYLGRPGYPGWHLECAAIIHKELGEPIDIHTGGIDHVPVHHTNEIAETYAAYQHKLARYWLHCDFITVDGLKISKSIGNTYTLEDLETRGFSPMDYKMWLLSGHYQGARNFTFDGLWSAHNRRANWRSRIALCYQKEIVGDDIFDEVLEAVNDNLNSAKAFALIDNAELSFDDWKRVDELFGLRLIADTPNLSANIQALMSERAAARKAKDYAKSDKLRDQLLDEGVAVKDTADGIVWQYV